MQSVFARRRHTRYNDTTYEELDRVADGARNLLRWRLRQRR